jgi:hypothetical protein
MLFIARRAYAADALAAGTDELYARQGGAVVTFDGGGRPIRRCAALEARPERALPRRPLAFDAEDLLRLGGLPDDDTTTTDAEDLLRDEGIARPARRRVSETIPEVRALAADPSANRVWIATSIGVLRGDRDGCRPAGLAGRDLILIAASRDTVVAASERLLWRVDLERRIPTQVTGLTGRPRALAMSPTGFVLIADDDGVGEVGPTGEVNRLLDRPADALVVCDGRAVALTAEATYVWTSGNEPVARGPRLPARQLACGQPPQARFVATGTGVWTSPDGATWTAVEGWRGREVGGAAAVAGRTWLAAAGRVVALDDEPRRRAAEVTLPVAPALDTRRWIAPRFPWPEVAVLFGAQQTATRFGWAVELVVAFPLGRRGLHRADQRPIAVELVRRDSALAAAVAGLSGAGDDESAAVRRALVDERNALR